MSLPLVSVVLPIYNGEKYLRDTIETVLTQDYPSIELILIDDGSTDNSALIAKSYPNAHYIYQYNRGVATARNIGVAASKGELIAFLDQDDIWENNKIREQVTYFQQHPEISYVITKMKLFLETGVTKPSWLREEFLQGEYAAFLPSTLMVKKSVFYQVGPFDSQYQVTTDGDWFFRANDLHIPFATLPIALLHRRIHQTNESYHVKNTNIELLKILRNSIQRKKTNEVNHYA